MPYSQSILAGLIRGLLDRDSPESEDKPPLALAEPNPNGLAEPNLTEASPLQVAADLVLDAAEAPPVDPAKLIQVEAEQPVTASISVEPSAVDVNEPGPTPILGANELPPVDPAQVLQVEAEGQPDTGSELTTEAHPEGQALALTTATTPAETPELGSRQFPASSKYLFKVLANLHKDPNLTKLEQSFKSEPNFDPNMLDQVRFDSLHYALQGIELTGPKDGAVGEDDDEDEDDGEDATPAQPEHPAFDLLQTSLHIREDILPPNHPSVASSLAHRAQFVSVTEPKDAVPFLLEAIKLLEKEYRRRSLNDHRIVQLAELYVQYAALLVRCNEAHEAPAQLDKAADLIDSLPMRFHDIRHYRDLRLLIPSVRSLVYSNFSRPEDSLAAMEQGHAVLQEMNHQEISPSILAGFYERLAHLYNDSGAIDKAEAVLLEGAGELANNSSAIASYHRADLWFAAASVAGQTEPLRALDHSLTSIGLYEPIGLPSKLVMARQQAAYLHSRLGQHEKAFLQYAECYNYYEQRRNAEAAAFFDSWGRNFLNMHAYDPAMFAFTQAGELFSQRAGDDDIVAPSLMSMARAGLTLVVSGEEQEGDSLDLISLQVSLCSRKHWPSLSSTLS